MGLFALRSSEFGDKITFVISYTTDEQKCLSVVFYFSAEGSVMTELVRIEEKELKHAFIMMKKGFFPTFVKYRDVINPVFTTYKKFCSKYNKSEMFWVVSDGEKVGEISFAVKDDSVHITDFFILSEYQNRKIGQETLRIAEDMYSHDVWHLFTIKEEKRNVHLYERFGYIPTGVQRRINKRMTLVEYEKRK